MRDPDIIKDYECICYHGTDKNNVNSILEDGFIESRKEKESLGTGVYFYENDILQAIRWCTKAQRERIDTPAVIKAKIKTNKLIDLTLTANYNYLFALTVRLRKRYKRKYKGKDLTPRQIFDFLYEINNYCAIKHVFKVRKCHSIIGTDIERMQIQICVRKQCAIIELEEVDISGYEEIS